MAKNVLNFLNSENGFWTDILKYKYGDAHHWNLKIPP